MPFLVAKIVAIFTPQGEPVGCRTETVSEELPLGEARTEADRLARGELQKPDLEMDSFVVVEAGAPGFNPVYQGRAF